MEGTMLSAIKQTIKYKCQGLHYYIHSFYAVDLHLRISILSEKITLKKLIFEFSINERQKYQYYNESLSQKHRINIQKFSSFKGNSWIGKQALKFLLTSIDKSGRNISFCVFSNKDDICRNRYHFNHWYYR